MRALGALEPRYADEHVPLAIMLGAISALSALRRVLPPPTAGPAPPAHDVAGRPPEPFLALVLGAVVTHERLLHLFGAALGEAGRGSLPAGSGPVLLEGILR